MSHTRTMSLFEEFIAEIEAEAQAEGPTAVSELEALDTRYRVSLRLGLRRAELGLTQQQVAEMVGIPRAELKDIEAGAVDLPVGLLGAICHVLELDLQLRAKSAA